MIAPNVPVLKPRDKAFRMILIGSLKSFLLHVIFIEKATPFYLLVYVRSTEIVFDQRSEKNWHG